MRAHVIVALFVLGLFSGASPNTAAAAPATTFSGQATVVRGSIPLAPFAPGLLPCTPSSQYFCIVDTGPLTASESTSGGAHEASLACYPNGNGCVISSPVGDPTGGAVRARVLHASVVAGGNKSTAEASVADLGLKVAGVNLSADFLTARAIAKCEGGTATVTGSSEIAGVNSQPVLGIGPYTVTVAETPNYDVLAHAPAPVADLFPTGTAIIINKQSPGSNASGGQQIDVTALYINVPGVAELFIADTHADITCAVAQCQGQNAFVTSGGFIDPTGSDKQHFAAAGRNGTNWGHVVYRDTMSGFTLHVHNPYGVVYDNFETLTAAATTQGFDTSKLDPRKFEGGAILSWPVTDQGGGKVLLVDEGEPGRADYFQILATGAPSGGDLLAGGNIQMHGKC